MHPLSLLIIAIFCLSCNAQPAETNGTESPATSSISQPPQPVSQSMDWPKPSRYLDGMPVYESFAEIEPLFSMDNDTAYVINFWATWCKPCVKELPYFEALRDAHQQDKVKVILVSLDFPKQLESRLVPFVKERQLESEVVVLLDGKYNDWIDKVSTDWTGAIPATLFYKGARKHFLGTSVESTEELEEMLSKL
jgi:thiol-disulfide isomerase/thioredoxin